MFTYIDPTVRERLTEQGKLFQVDRDGVRLPPGVAGTGGHTISVLGPIPLPLKLCERHFQVQWYACVRNTELGKIEELADDLRAQDGQRSFATLASYMAVNSVMVIGDPARFHNPLVRVHSSCLTGDVFGSQRCECGPQMQAALDRISNDEQEDTYQANRSLGLPDDSRDFSDAASLLKYFLAGKSFRLMTNNPKKVKDLGDHGVTGITRVKHVIGVSDSNRRYLSAKQDWGHEIEPEDID
jgi:GTP cyclohydrolase II